MDIDPTVGRREFGSLMTFALEIHLGALFVIVKS